MLGKFGKFDQPATPAKNKATKLNALDDAGLLANQNWKIVRASSESRANGRGAASAIDGDPRTHWHTQFQDELAKHPHELVIDLGQPATIRGFRYLARQDVGWNGAVAKCEFFVSDSPNEFGSAVATPEFTKSKKSQETACEPVKGRYVLLRVLSEVNGGPWASVAELGVVGE